MKGIKIKGYGAYAPSLKVSNDDLSKIVDTNDEWIRTRTGIEQRHISEGQDTSDFAIEACKIALDRSGIKGDEIDLIVVATITPDMITPSVACLIQKALGAKKAMAFDISAACSGFIYALQVTYSMMECNSNFNKALVIGSETLSKVLDWNDRSTCVLFGDGSGAVVLSKEEMETKKIASFFSLSEGDKGEALEAGAFDVINPYVKEVSVKNKKVMMNGQDVFKFAVKSIVKAVNKLLTENNLTIDDIDYIVPHQANCRIIEFAAKKLNVDIDKCYINLNKYGNTSSASIPLALNEMFEEGYLLEGKKIIMVGFGGGLTFGSFLVEL